MPNGTENFRVSPYCVAQTMKGLCGHKYYVVSVGEDFVKKYPGLSWWYVLEGVPVMGGFDVKEACNTLGEALEWITMGPARTIYPVNDSVQIKPVLEHDESWRRSPFDLRITSAEYRENFAKALSASGGVKAFAGLPLPYPQLPPEKVELVEAASHTQWRVADATNFQLWGK